MLNGLDLMGMGTIITVCLYTAIAVILIVFIAKNKDG